MKKRRFTIIRTTAFAALFGIGNVVPLATSANALAAEARTQVSPGLVLPPFDPVSGKMLFASKGCVVCHAVNGVGGTDAPEIDASTMAPEMSPFDFVAKMWNHSMGMIAMQQDELGGQITFENGQQIADIIAFLHDAAVQKTFSEDDIPPDIKKRLEADKDDDGAHGSMMRNGTGTYNDSMMNGGSMMGNQRRNMMHGN